MIEIKTLNLKNNGENENSESKFNANEMLRETDLENYDKIKIAKSSNSSTILNRDDEDIEKLKKEIFNK